VLRRGQPVHLWHLYIHKYQIKFVLCDPFESLLPVFRQGCNVAHLLEHTKSHGLVHRVVFYEKDLESAPTLVRFFMSRKRVFGGAQWPSKRGQDRGEQF
jgi:hypothetical protein